MSVIKKCSSHQSLLSTGFHPKYIKLQTWVKLTFNTQKSSSPAAKFDSGTPSKSERKSAPILREEVKLNLTLKCNHVHIGPFFAGGLCSYIKRSAFVSSARVEILGSYGLLCCNQECFWLREVCCKCLELMSGLVDLHSTLKIFIKIHVKILAREETSDQHSGQSRVQNKIWE